jgi:hypothetical protein
MNYSNSRGGVKVESYQRPRGPRRKGSWGGTRHSESRVYPCPGCKVENRLTASEVRRGYQCDACADAEEFGGPAH